MERTGRIFNILVFSIIIYSLSICESWSSWFFGRGDITEKSASPQAKTVLPEDKEPCKDLIAPIPQAKTVLCIGDKDPALLAYALTVLNDHELQKNQDVRDSIDQVVGSGTGALLGILMMMRGNNNQYAYSMKEILNLLTYHYDAQGNSSTGKLEENIAQLSKSVRKDTTFLVVQDMSTNKFWLQDAHQHQYTGAEQQKLYYPLHLPWTVLECWKEQIEKEKKKTTVKLLSLELSISADDLKTQQNDNPTLTTITSYAQTWAPTLISVGFCFIDYVRKFKDNARAEILIELQQSLKLQQQTFSQQETAVANEARRSSDPTSSSQLQLEYKPFGITPDLANLDGHVLTTLKKMKEKRGWPTKLSQWFFNIENPDSQLWHQRADSVFDLLVGFDFGSTEDTPKIFKLFEIAPNKSEFHKTIQEWAKDKGQLLVLAWVGKTIYTLRNDLEMKSFFEKTKTFLANFIPTYLNLIAINDVSPLIDQLEIAQRNLQEEYIPPRMIWTTEIMDQYRGLPLDRSFSIFLFYRFKSLTEGETKQSLLRDQILPNKLGTTFDDPYLVSADEWTEVAQEEIEKHNQQKSNLSKGKDIGALGINAAIALAGSQEIKASNHGTFVERLTDLKNSIKLTKGEGSQTLSSSVALGTHDEEGFDEMLK